MKRYSLLILVLLFACKNNTSKTTLLGSATCSSITEENGIKVFHNYYYENLENGGVYLVNKNTKLDEPLKNNYSIMPIMPKEDSAKWQLSFVAEKYAINKNILLTESNDTSKVSSYLMYNLSNGNLLLPYTYDKFSVLFSDETQKRWIGFYSGSGVRQKESNLKFEDNTLGFISYANQNQLLQQIVLKAKDKEWVSKLDIAAPVIELMPVSENAMSMPGGKTLYFSDTNNVVNFKVMITFYSKEDYSPHVIVIPIVKDKIVTLEFDSGESIFEVEVVKES